MPELDRRNFLKLVGASAGAAAAAGCSDHVEKLIPYVVQPEEITPGNAVVYASTCRECPAACGLHVSTREGRPIKLEGNPDPTSASTSHVERVSTMRREACSHGRALHGLVQLHPRSQDAENVARYGCRGFEDALVNGRSVREDGGCYTEAGSPGPLQKTLAINLTFTFS